MCNTVYFMPNNCIVCTHFPCIVFNIFQTNGTCPAEITGFTLVDADLDTDISPLGDFIVSGLLLSIRADIRPCTPKVVASALITFDNETRCERFTPYVSFGDPSTRDVSNAAANYRGRNITEGKHVVTATPYTKGRCRGTPGKTVEQEFTVTPINTGPFCVDYVCDVGYLLRENAATRPGNDRETCCYREGTCAGAPVGTACSLGDIVNSLIPNPSFEEFTGCPTTFSQLSFAESWVQATEGTSDYWIGAPTCNDNWRVGLGGIGEIPQQATDGNAFVGSIKTTGRDYYEYVGACLINPLLTGVEYTFTLDIAAATSSSSFGGDTNGATELLCIPSCDDFQIPGFDYKGDSYEILATALPTGGLVGGGDWKSITFVVTPSSDCPAIMFGPGIAQTIESGQAGTYVIYDSLNLQQGSAGVCDSKGECVPAP